MFWRACDDIRTVASLVDDDDGKQAKESGVFDFCELVAQPDPHFKGEEKASIHAPFAISVPILWITRQLWHIQRGYEFANEKCVLINSDFVVRIRPDLWFFDSKPDFMHDTILTPWWGTFGGVNDRLATMPRHLSERYFTAFSRVDKFLSEGCPMHPESIMRAAIGDGPWSPNLNCVFGSLRKNGEMRLPEIQTFELRR